MPKKSSNTVKIYYPEFSGEEVIEKIRDRINELLKKLPIKSVILFGSYAENRYTAASDIDLLIVYEDPKRNDAYNICWDELGIPQLQLHVYTSSEFKKLEASGSILPKEVKKKGIVIWKSNGT